MIELIPAIDIIDGKCVRLSKGEFDTQKVYSESPLELAKEFEGIGCHRLHLVDLDGARQKHIVNYRILESITSQTNLVVDFGGGLKSDEDLHIAFESGASMITGGTIAVNNPDIFTSWLEKYGTNKIILGADARNRKISTSGWIEDSELDILDFIKNYISKGISQVISTDISVDGTLNGPSIELYKDILTQTTGVYLIASGGVGSMDDIYKLDEISIPAVIVGKAIYEGKITSKQIESFNLQK